MQRLKLILPIESVAYPLTGIGRYAYELAQGLTSHPCVSDVRLLRHLQFVDAEKLAILAFQGVGSRAMPFKARSRYLVQSRRYLRFLSRSVQFLRCSRYKHHIFHSPNYTLPAFPGRSVSTVHDLSIFRFPQFFSLCVL